MGAERLYRTSIWSPIRTPLEGRFALKVSEEKGILSMGLNDIPVSLITNAQFSVHDSETDPRNKFITIHKLDYDIELILETSAKVIECVEIFKKFDATEVSVSPFITLPKEARVGPVRCPPTFRVDPRYLIFIASNRAQAIRHECPENVTVEDAIAVIFQNFLNTKKTSTEKKEPIKSSLVEEKKEETVKLKSRFNPKSMNEVD